MREEGVTFITREQAREIDRKAVEEIGVPSICLMENAGRQVADAACEMAPGGRVLVVCGTGNNGGDGFVAARHLFLRGVSVEVVLLGDKEKLTPDALINHNAAIGSGVAVTGELPAELSFDLVIDALLGTGISGEVREPYASAINAINGSGVSVLAADIPSGLDCDTGEILGVCVKAKRTVTFILSKVGFAKSSGPDMCGTITVADIGIPHCR